MSKNPSTNFLPTVFQSPTNKKFFGATLDQLTTDANDIPLNGYIAVSYTHLTLPTNREV